MGCIRKVHNPYLLGNYIRQEKDKIKCTNTLYAMQIDFMEKCMVGEGEHGEGGKYKYAQKGEEIIFLNQRMNSWKNTKKSDKKQHAHRGGLQGILVKFLNSVKVKRTKMCEDNFYQENGTPKSVQLSAVDQISRLHSSSICFSMTQHAKILVEMYIDLERIYIICDTLYAMCIPFLL